MSRKRVYNQESIDIQSRFWQALDFLCRENKINGLRTYSRLYNIDARNFYAQQKDQTKGHFQAGWLVPLVNVYHISPRWILTGNGNMTTAHYR